MKISRLKLKCTILVVTCCFFCGSILAQVKKPVAKPAPKLTPKIETPIIEIEAITKDGKKVVLKSNKTWDYAKEVTASEKPKENLPIKKLPVPFLADNVKEVLAFLAKDEWQFRKSEFETEQEYSNRLSKIQYETSTTKKPLTDVVFIFPLKQDYDAERETFSFELYNFLDYRTVSTLKLVRRRNNEYLVYEPSFSFKMPREQARKVAYNLKVAVFGYPVKIDNSYKDDSKLSFFLKRLVVFNEGTGDIYHELENFKSISGVVF